ncbi:MAG: hypothetical protein KDJ52_17185 [Anaerolineae bacterium]|nr:hypothetical protein [Anaerolineae bacterium]MCB0211076.1 hypothetical protein [Anaerolineae bacterium]
MSRRKDPMDELAGEIGCLVIGLMWAAAVAVFALIFKSTQQSPEQQLLQLQSSGAWRWLIEPYDCPHCGTVNESYKSRCYQCGAKLIDDPQPVKSGWGQVDYRQPGQGSSLSDRGIAFVILAVIVLLFILAAVNGGNF